MSRSRHSHNGDIPEALPPTRKQHIHRWKHVCHVRPPLFSDGAIMIYFSLISRSWGSKLLCTETSVSEVPREFSKNVQWLLGNRCSTQLRKGREVRQTKPGPVSLCVSFCRSVVLARCHWQTYGKGDPLPNNVVPWERNRISWYNVTSSPRPQLDRWCHGSQNIYWLISTTATVYSHSVIQRKECLRLYTRHHYSRSWRSGIFCSITELKDKWPCEQGNIYVNENWTHRII